MEPKKEFEINSIKTAIIMGIMSLRITEKEKISEVIEKSVNHLINHALKTRKIDLKDYSESTIADLKDYFKINNIEKIKENKDMN